MFSLHFSTVSFGRLLFCRYPSKSDLISPSRVSCRLNNGTSSASYSSGESIITRPYRSGSTLECADLPGESPCMLVMGVGSLMAWFVFFASTSSSSFSLMVLSSEVIRVTGLSFVRARINPAEIFLFGTIIWPYDYMRLGPATSIPDLDLIPEFCLYDFIAFS